MIPITGRKKGDVPTIAVLINDYGDRSASSIWRGIADAAQQEGVNLVCVAGGAMDSPGEGERNRNFLYQLIDPDNLDGLIIWGGIMNMFASHGSVKDYISRFHSLPKVSMGLELEGIPSVLLDNYRGIWAAVSHLVEVHKRRQIAFICGPKGHAEADARFEAYQSSLAHYGIPYNPALVLPGNYDPEDGIRGVEMLKLERQVEFDAVITNDDSVACRALETCWRLGIQAPGEVSIIGFDDEEEARCFTPPLTTVRFHGYGQGQVAARSLFAQMRGEKVPLVEWVPLQLIVRQSCGCSSRAVERAAVPPKHFSRGRLHTSLKAQRPKIADELRQVAGLDKNDTVEVCALLDAFARDLRPPAHQPQVFLEALERLIQKFKKGAKNLSELDNLLSEMRQQILPLIPARSPAKDHAENLWQQARVMIAEVSLREAFYHQMRTRTLSITLGDIGKEMGITFGRQQLADAIFELIPEVGIDGCFLSLFEQPDQPFAWSRLVLAFQHGKRFPIADEGIRFPSAQLIPEGFTLGEVAANWMMVPLFLQQEALGFALFAAGSAYWEVYEVLASHLSSALKGIQLYNRVLDLSLTDGLTGIANRRAFEMFLNKEVERNYRYHLGLSLIFIDIDHFKEYNDVYGHVAGDEALIMIAQELNQSARRGLDLMARIGGDEFAMLLSGTPLPEAVKIAEQIRQRIESLQSFRNPITLSLGVAAMRDDFSGPLQLIEQADQALYTAKKGGRNLVSIQ